MNEASLWRLALAQQIAHHYSINPKVRAVSLGGSVAQGCADRYSNIDLAVYWSEAPTQKERRDMLTRARGRRGILVHYNREAGCWMDHYEVDGVTICVRHITVETTERLLADVLERSDPALAKQQHLAALVSALPLSDPSLLTNWQRQAMVYLHALSVAMVRAYLLFRPGWEQEMLAERNDLLLLYDSVCTEQKLMFLVLMGLNRLYYPGWQRMERLVKQMQVAPPNTATGRRHF